MRYEISEDAVKNINDNLECIKKALLLMDRTGDESMDSTIRRAGVLADITQKDMNKNLVAIPNGDDEDIFSDVDEEVIDG